ncbi:divalent metal cation (Fe/Co/Zn/Cd) transporter [Shimia isoporae]|uniref:Divalent metal cation (Fe/Co/Zn/Cd) transporter n=1 Tax=Shimia isoporae TaxID=647720 RepID=A0A4R1NA28_9RHOB|nr:cation transporter [Shimia isoporae]TCL00015.1 divalent metal cation (Fe/Co/Zn/Cd) transporter [Shimia isoporae]
MDKAQIKQIEARTLVIAMCGSVFMGVAGVAAAVLSNSTAILMDGMFSLIGFTSALIGRKISLNAGAAPDRFRPLGYAADEAVFVTFRSLSLIGLILFAAGSAGMNIANYLSGEPVAELHYAPMFVYFVVVGATCFGLWALHHRTWKRTGKNSEILRLESKAAAVDGALTFGTFAGLGIIFLLGDGVLAPIAPIGDSIVVIVLCAGSIWQIWREMLGGVGELLGVTARPDVIAKVRRAIRDRMEAAPGEMTDLSVVKLGRTYLVSVYCNPRQAITAQEIDALNIALIADVKKVLPNSDVMLCISEFPRSWPDGMVPD